MTSPLRSPDRPAEPALIFGLISSLLAAVVPLSFPGLGAGQVSLIDAALVAAGGVLIALRTRPVTPGAFVAMVSAGAALLAGYGVSVPAPWVGFVTAVVMAVFSFVARAHVTPVAGPGSV